MKICSVCKNEFTPTREWHVYCSVLCRYKNELVLAQKREREKATKKLKQIPDKQCPQCKKIFSVLDDRKHAYKTYCSTRCRQRWNNRQQKRREREIVKNTELDIERYWKIINRKKVQDSNYFYLRRGGKKKGKNHLHLKEWIEIKEKHDYKCAICEVRETVENPLTVDHIIPITRQGGNNKENIQPLCKSCNSRKGNR